MYSIDIGSAFEIWVNIVTSGYPYTYGANHKTLKNEVVENNGFDCSSFVWYGLMHCKRIEQYIQDKYDGWENKFSCFTTNTMTDWLSKFPCTKHKFTSEDELLKGDILLYGDSYTHFNHTNVYYDDGKIIGAENSKDGIRISNFYKTGLKYYFRFNTEHTNQGVLMSYDERSICAILGNMKCESHCNPTLQEQGGKGFGLIQWTPKNGIGKDMVKNLSQKIGFKRSQYNTILNQVNIVNEELKGTLDGWYSTDKHPYKGVDFIHNKNNYDVEWLTYCYLENRERAGVSAIEERLKWANNFKKWLIDENFAESTDFETQLAKLQNKEYDGVVNDPCGYPIYIGTNDTGYLTDEQIKYNGTIIYLMFARGFQLQENLSANNYKNRRAYKPWKYFTFNQ